MKYKILPRRVTLLIYDDKDLAKYTASCQININGTKGTIDTLMGGDFYKFLIENGFDIFKSIGLEEVGAMMSTAHIKLLRRYLGDRVDIKVGNIINLESIPKEFVWVVITEKKPA